MLDGLLLDATYWICLTITLHNIGWTLLDATKEQRTTILFAPFCTKKKLQIELNEYISDWAPEITMGANLVGCPLYKVLICKTNNQRYMEEKQ